MRDEASRPDLIARNAGQARLRRMVQIFVFRVASSAGITASSCSSGCS
jgi:hypothetical protein